MNRRRVLAGTGMALTSAIAGCLASGDENRTGTNPDKNGNSTDPTSTDSDPTKTGTDTGENGNDGEMRRYTECSRAVIPYEQFPARVKEEIDAALDGPYTADRIYLGETLNTEESFISVDDEHYQATVSEQGEQDVLTLDRLDPKVLPDSRPVSVELSRDGRRTITIELIAEDGTVLVEKTRTLQPGGEVEFGETNRVGSHELRVTVAEDGETEDEYTTTVTINESTFSTIVLVEPDEITLTGAVAGLKYCDFVK